MESPGSPPLPPLLSLPEPSPISPLLTITQTSNRKTTQRVRLNTLLNHFPVSDGDGKSQSPLPVPSPSQSPPSATIVNTHGPLAATPLQELKPLGSSVIRVPTFKMSSFYKTTPWARLFESQLQERPGDSDCIKQILSTSLDTVTKVHEERIKTEMKQLENILEAAFQETISVELFGSARSSVFSFGSDIDLSINPAKPVLDPRSYLSLVSDVMAENNYVIHDTILHARVPVIKTETKTDIWGTGDADEADRIHTLVDIVLDNKMGCHNSQLISVYCQMDPRVRLFLLLLKKWSKAWLIADSRNGQLSSYGWTLLGLHYLQCCSPPIIPTLQSRNYIELSDPSKIVDAKLVGGSVRFSTDIEPWTSHNPGAVPPQLAKQFPPTKPRPENTHSLAQIFLGFFDFMTRFFHTRLHSATVREGVLSIRRGPNVPVHQNNSLDLPFHIEDPFQLNRDVGDRIGGTPLISAAIVLTRRLINDGVSIDKLLDNSFITDHLNELNETMPVFTQELMDCFDVKREIEVSVRIARRVFLRSPLHPNPLIVDESSLQTFTLEKPRHTFTLGKSPPNMNSPPLNAPLQRPVESHSESPVPLLGQSPPTILPLDTSVHLPLSLQKDTLASIGSPPLVLSTPVVEETVTISADNTPLFSTPNLAKSPPLPRLVLKQLEVQEEVKAATLATNHKPIQNFPILHTPHSVIPSRPIPAITMNNSPLLTTPERPQHIISPPNTTDSKQDPLKDVSHPKLPLLTTPQPAQPLLPNQPSPVPSASPIVVTPSPLTLPLDKPVLPPPTQASIHHPPAQTNPPLHHTPTSAHPLIVTPPAIQPVDITRPEFVAQKALPNQPVIKLNRSRRKPGFVPSPANPKAMSQDAASAVVVPTVGQHRQNGDPITQTSDDDIGPPPGLTRDDSDTE